MTPFIRGILRLGISLESGSKILNCTFRCASTTRKLKIVEGKNGERIVCSPHEDVVYPEVTLPEYVWKNVHNYSDKIALVCKTTCIPAYFVL